MRTYIYIYHTIFTYGEIYVYIYKYRESYVYTTRVKSRSLQTSTVPPQAFLFKRVVSRKSIRAQFELHPVRTGDVVELYSVLQVPGRSGGVSSPRARTYLVRWPWPNYSCATRSVDHRWKLTPKKPHAESDVDTLQMRRTLNPSFDENARDLINRCQGCSTRCRCCLKECSLVHAAEWLMFDKIKTKLAYS